MLIQAFVQRNDDSKETKEEIFLFEHSQEFAANCLWRQQ